MINRNLLLLYSGFILMIILSGFGAVYLADIKNVPTIIVILIAVSLSLLIGLISWRHLTLPLSKIGKEMTALLLGKSYKKIYTARLDEIGVIANFFNEITHSLETATAEIKERRRLSKEINTAAQIQQDLLPKNKPQIPGLDITAKTRPAAEIGGDSYDFITTNKQSIMYLGDVTGHGIPSGLVMMMVNTLVHSFASLGLPINEIMIRSNKELKPRIKKAMFMTMIMLAWDHEHSEMFFSGAGHEYLLVYRSESRSVEKIPSGGIALGMLPDNSRLIKLNPLPLKKNDIIVLYSDGLTEGRNAKGELFGESRLITALESCAQLENSDQIHEHLAATFSAFSETKEQLDDISLMVIKRTT